MNFKIAFRQIKKQRFYSIINIGGLAVGLACCMLIGLYIKHELSYDQHHSKADRIYRVTRDMNIQGLAQINAVTPAPLSKTLVADYPEVVKTARLNPYFGNAGTNLVLLEGKRQKIFEEGFVYADQSFFEIFDLPVVYGNANSLLESPEQMVISQRIADKYFPNENPVGKTLTLNDDADVTYKISGVIENIPSTSHFNYDFWLSMEQLEDSRANGWLFNNYYTYALLSPSANPQTLSEKMKEMEGKYVASQMKELSNIDADEFHAAGGYYHFFMKPVTDIHLNSNPKSPQLQAGGDSRTVKIFGIIALLILFIALFNYMNLSTAQAATRAKEVGVRKVLGSMKSQLIKQFLSESLLTTSIAFVIALFLIEAFAKLFNQITEINLVVPWLSWWFIPVVLLGVGITGLLAGLYPAFYLSDFRPIETLKGELNKGRKSQWLRSSLVVFQFAISVALIIGTIVIYNQMQFIQNKKLGFNKDQVLLIRDAYTLGNGDNDRLSQQLQNLKNQIENLSEVTSVSVSNYMPTDGFSRNSLPVYSDEAINESTISFVQRWVVDEDYIPTLEMQLAEGRNFSEQIASDTQAVIINQALAKDLGYTNATDRQIQFADGTKFSIVGVVEDFHFKTIREEIEPAYLQIGFSPSTIAVRSSGADMEALIAKSEALWNQFAPEQTFRYSFLDESFSSMYNAEAKIGKILTAFSLLAIFIACLGLFGLASFMAAQKKKEIGVRKVLGASIANIVGLLTKDFLKLVVIALVIAIPLAWYFMNSWLDNFAYRISIEWWVFLVAGLLAVGLAFFTVSWQSIKAAITNPVNSLRNS